MPLARTRTVAALALVAMLLLACVPTLGRVFGAGIAPAVATAAAKPMSMSMPGMAGMSAAEHAAHMRRLAATRADSGRATDPPADPHRGHAGRDCEYCPLLAGLSQVDGCAWLPPATQQLAPWIGRTVASPPVEAPVPKLGSQGPPRVERG